MGNTKAQSPDMEKTRKRVIGEYKKGAKPKALADKYGLSVNTVKSWISRYKTKAKDAPGKQGASSASAPGRRGAPLGNTNAIGNNGGAPLGNTNALKHGGYAKVYWDALDETEQQLIQEMDFDGERLLLDEISLLSIRERRIMLSIARHKEAKGGLAVSNIVRSEEKREFASEEEKQLYEERVAVKVEVGEQLPGRSYRITTTTEATYDIIQRLEEALTRCQAQKQRCIESLNRLRLERGDDGKTAPDNNLLQALLAATTEDIDTDDIQELEQETDHSDDVVE